MSSVIKKGTLLGESCYRIENGKRITYRATSKLLKGVSSIIQSRNWKALPLVKDLSAKAPADENNYVGWGLHYMYFLQSKGYIGKIDFEPAIHDMRPCDFMERRVDLHMDEWLINKKKELNCEELHKWNMNLAADKFYYMEMDAKETIDVFRAIKDFNYNGVYFGFMADLEANKVSKYSEKGYLEWLKKNGYIDFYEVVDMKKIIPMAF